METMALIDRKINACAISLVGLGESPYSLDSFHKLFFDNYITDMERSSSGVKVT